MGLSRCRDDACMTAPSCFSPSPSHRWTLGLTSQHPWDCREGEADAWIQPSFRECGRPTGRSTPVTRAAQASAPPPPPRPGRTGPAGRRGARPARVFPGQRGDEHPDPRGGERPHRAARLRRRRRHRGRPGRHLQVHHQRGQHRRHRPAHGHRAPARLYAPPDPTTRGPALDLDQRRARRRARSSPRATRPTIAAGLDLPDGDVPDLRARRRLQDRRRALHRADGRRRAASRSSSSRYPLPDSTVQGQVFADMAPDQRRHTTPASRPSPGFAGPPQRHPRRDQHRRLRQPAVHDVRRRGPGHPRDPAGATSTPTCCPVVDQVGGKCLSDADGIADHPAPGHQPLHARPSPRRTAQHWIQTTTLEGNHDWDTWVMEGSTGYDTEFTLAGEPSRPRCSASPSRPRTGSRSTARAPGTITGRRRCAIQHYVPPEGRQLRPLQRLHRHQGRQRPITDAVALARRPRRTATRPSGSGRATPTAASTSPACPTATTS